MILHVHLSMFYVVTPTYITAKPESDTTISVYRIRLLYEKTYISSKLSLVIKYCDVSSAIFDCVWGKWDPLGVIAYVTT